jgi:hypothetical protein
MTAKLQKQINQVEKVIREHHLAGSLDFHQMAVQIIAVLAVSKTVLSTDTNKPNIACTKTK